MQWLGIHAVDWAVLAVYFAVILFIGVFVGGKKTHTLGDFYVAGSKWGVITSFLFVFASALAGNEAVVVSSQAYQTGLSGVWYWWNFLFATPIYYLFCTHFRRARVYNLAEFVEMRFGTPVAAVYSLCAGTITCLFIGMMVLAIGKIIAGVTQFDVNYCVWTIAVVVAAYVFSGGMMSALLTDLVQGLMCLLFLGVVLLPFAWLEAGGWDRLQSLPVERWNLTSPEMSLLTVLAFNISALAGGIAAPWIYNWISVSRNERAATQCGWGHLWKRVVTLLFAVYGILFFLIDPAIAHPEQAWGDLMRRLLPAGVGLLGLLVASFFAAAMSSVDTYATTSSAMFVDFFYRRVVGRGKSNAHYLALARYWAVGSIVLGAGSTVFISGISDYVKLALSLLSFLGIPILFGVAWRKANRTGAWLSFCLGIGSYIMVMFVTAPSAESFAKIDDQRFYQCVFTATSLSLLGMIAGSLIGKAEDPLRLARFYVILATPVGEEKQLVDAGIRLPALIDAGLIPESPGEEVLRADEVHRLEAAYAKNKLFGEQSTIELRREPTHPWYFRGFVLITISCAGLVVGTWLATRVLFVW